MLTKHRWTKHSTDNAAISCTSKMEMDKILSELKSLSTAEREKLYDCNFCGNTYKCGCRLVAHIQQHHKRKVISKRVLCPYCLTVCKSKCSLLRHIYYEHTVYQPAAYLALQDKRHILWRITGQAVPTFLWWLLFLDIRVQDYFSLAILSFLFVLFNKCFLTFFLWQYFHSYLLCSINNF